MYILVRFSVYRHAVAAASAGDHGGALHQPWTRADLRDHWTLLPAERALVDASRPDHTRLGVAVLLKFFQLAWRFPHSRAEVPAPVVADVAQQLGVPATCFLRYDWASRMAALHRASIRTLRRVREATLLDQQQVTDWLVAQVLPQTQQPEAVRAAFMDRGRALGLEPPTPDRISRHVRSALAISDDHLGTTVLQRLSAATQAKLDELLRVPTPEDTVASRPGGAGRSALADLQRDPGPFGVETVIQEAAKLDRIRQLDLPPDLFHQLPAKLLDRFRQRVVAEELHELRRHPPARRLTLLAASCWRKPSHRVVALPHFW